MISGLEKDCFWRHSVSIATELMIQQIEMLNEAKTTYKIECIFGKKIVPQNLITHSILIHPSHKNIFRFFLSVLFTRSLSFLHFRAVHFIFLPLLFFLFVNLILFSVIIYWIACALQFPRCMMPVGHEWAGAQIN